MEMRSQYKMECQKISMGVKIERNSQYRLRFNSERVHLYSEEQFMCPLIELNDCGIDICVPFLLLLN